MNVTSNHLTFESKHLDIESMDMNVTSKHLDVESKDMNVTSKLLILESRVLIFGDLSSHYLFIQVPLVNEKR